MSKLYVPEGVWLVCSEGTNTQQLTVVSQSMVKIDGDHLVATVEDKVKADFGCKKGALFTAIAMALYAAVVAVAVVGTGGLAACAIIGAAGAAGAVGGGIIGRLMPCGCAFCMGSWQNHSPSVKVCGNYALLEDSISICSKGGTIKIMFSKEAAEAFAALVAAKSNVEIANIAAIAFVAPFVLHSAGSAILGFKSGFSAALGVSKLSAAAFVGETVVVGGVGYGADRLYKFAKESLYSAGNVNDYIQGKTEKEVNNVLNDSSVIDSQQWAFDTKEDIGYSTHIKDRETISITDYEKMTYEREGYLSTTSGYVDERGWEVVEERSDWKYRLESKRCIENLPETDKLTQSSGTYYMKEEYASIKGKDYNVGKNTFKDGLNAINPLKDKEGRAMFLLDLALDIYRGIVNKLLEGSFDNYKEAIALEQDARDKYNVKTK